MGFSGSTSGKESICNARDAGLIPGLGRHPGGGHGSPLKYSCLENPMDRGAWWAIVYRITKSWIRLKWLISHIMDILFRKKKKMLFFSASEIGEWITSCKISVSFGWIVYGWNEFLMTFAQKYEKTSKQKQRNQNLTLISL